MGNIIIPSQRKPSYRKGYARRPSESKRSDLWRGLAACWQPFLGISGMVLRDVTGFGNHGTLTNMVMGDWVINNNPRSPGYALNFNGTNAYINAGSDVSLDFLGMTTWTCWVKPDTLANKRYLSKGTQSSIFARSNQNLVFKREFNTNQLEVETNAIITTGEWQHIAFVWDGSAIASDVRIYHNGIEQAHSIDISGIGGVADNSAEDFLIGDAEGLNFYDGLMDDIRIYSRVLSVSEIQDIYQYPKAMFEFADRSIASVTVTALTGNTAITLPLPLLSAFSSPGIVDITLPQFVTDATSLSHGTASLTLPLLTVVSTSSTIIGDTAITLPLLTVSSTSLSHGVSDLDLPILIISAIGSPGINSANITLPQFVVQGNSGATGSLTLPALTVLSTSTVTTIGDVSIALPVFIVNGSSGLGGDITLPLLMVKIRAYNGSAPECVVMNTKNLAVSEYISYGFNSMTEFNGAYLIADQNGIYEADTSDTDNAGVDDYAIKAHIKTGRVDIHKNNKNVVRNGWLNYQTNGSVQVVSTADKKANRTYLLPYHSGLNGINERRVKFERGIRNRFFDFKIQNIIGSQLEIDKLTIMLEPVVSKRR